MHRRFLMLAGLTVLAGCATTGAPRIAAPAGASFEELEPLFGATAGKEALVIRVSSSGCTKKEDFAFFVERREGAMTIVFGRKRLDTCRSFAAGRTELTFSYVELGIEPGTAIFVLNPYRAWFGPGD